MNGRNHLKRVDLTTSKELLFWQQPSSFKEWLRNPVLRGHTAYHKSDPKTKRRLPPEKWELHYDTHPEHRLISDEEYAEICIILDTNSRCFAAPNKTSYLTRLICCDVCGHKMVLKNAPKYSYYGCRHGSTDCGNRKCIRVEKLNEAIITAVLERASAVSEVETRDCGDPEQSPEVQELRSKIADAEALVAKYPSDEEFRQKLQTSRKALQKLLKGFGQLNYIKATAQEILRHPHARQLAFWLSLTQEERKTIYDKLVAQVRVRNGVVTSVQLKV